MASGYPTPVVQRGSMSISSGGDGRAQEAFAPDRSGSGVAVVPSFDMNTLFGPTTGNELQFHGPRGTHYDKTDVFNKGVKWVINIAIGNVLQGIAIFADIDPEPLEDLLLNVITETVVVAPVATAVPGDPGVPGRITHGREIKHTSTGMPFSGYITISMDLYRMALVSTDVCQGALVAYRTIESQLLSLAASCVVQLWRSVQSTLQDPQLMNIMNNTFGLGNSVQVGKNFYELISKQRANNNGNIPGTNVLRNVLAVLPHGFNGLGNGIANIMHTLPDTTNTRTVEVVRTYKALSSPGADGDATLTLAVMPRGLTDHHRVPVLNIFAAPPNVGNNIDLPGLTRPGDTDLLNTHVDLRVLLDDLRPEHIIAIHDALVVPPAGAAGAAAPGPAAAAEAERVGLLRETFTEAQIGLLPNAAARDADAAGLKLRTLLNRGITPFRFVILGAVGFRTADIVLLLNDSRVKIKRTHVTPITEERQINNEIAFGVKTKFFCVPSFNFDGAVLRNACNFGPSDDNNHEVQAVFCDGPDDNALISNIAEQFLHANAGDRDRLGKFVFCVMPHSAKADRVLSDMASVTDIDASLPQLRGHAIKPQVTLYNRISQQYIAPATVDAVSVADSTAGTREMLPIVAQLPVAYKASRAATTPTCVWGPLGTNPYSQTSGAFPASASMMPYFRAPEGVPITA